ncbi:hypothetical protein GS429_20655 [Natronorubrum sp. JWXQ-INN-674]|uniref:Uncharacterized protein n=1 Tax=Natronorubrum halalkaliphilum TaxID=2691917 RepID=A0A6B0VSJ3_9EURY|nr:hypothetical protein [Natronorubrum halalkaliphilum]MXV64434.1 hypothetical protein [Natronorubrum halalkaliphilum]
MALVFLGLNDEREGWERIGKVNDGEIIEDPTGELEATIQGVYDLEDEERLKRIFNNHYINAVPVTEDGGKE